MNVFQAIFLGILQGLAEFLPISSSGHLVLFEHILGVNEPGMTFDVMLHVATLIPIFIIYRKDIVEIIKKPLQKTTYLIIVGTIPTVIVGLFFKDYIEVLFKSGKLLSLSFFYTGALLLYTDKIKIEKGKSMNKMSYIDATIVGILQAIAITPGISRSGSTIAGALYRKVDRKIAAKYSFLLSIIASLGAVVLEAKDFITGEAQMDNLFSTEYAAGFIVAAVVGYFAIRFMIKLISECKLRYFSFYVFALGVLILIDQFVTHIFF